MNQNEEIITHIKDLQEFARKQDARSYSIEDIMKIFNEKKNGGINGIKPPAPIHHIKTGNVNTNTYPQLEEEDLSAKLLGSLISNILCQENARRKAKKIISEITELLKEHNLYLPNKKSNGR